MSSISINAGSVRRRAPTHITPTRAKRWYEVGEDGVRRLMTDADDSPKSEIDDRSLQFIDATQLLLRPYKPPAFYAKHIAPKQSVVLLSGDTGAAKTAFMLHASVAIATDSPVADRFAVEPGATVLYVNGEMGSDVLDRYLREAAAGLNVAIAPNRLFFEGSDAVAEWRFQENRASLADLVATLHPNIVILDTMRALLIDDESDTTEVRSAFAWLRTNIVNALGATVIVAHHLRKIGPVSNSARERVAGTRDIIASVDVHLAAKARDGKPLHALKMDKTRTPFEGVTMGTEWPIEARLESGAPNRSYFIASDPESAVNAANASADDRAVDEIRSRLEAEGALTVDDLNATGGAPKRALSRLKKTNEVVIAGKSGKKTLYALRDAIAECETLL